MQENTPTGSAQWKILTVFLFIDLVICIVSFQFPFFWDSILTATIAQYFYKHGVGNLIIPLQWDAGHPPFFALYIQFLWRILGKSLWVSHLAMLPFLWLKTYSAMAITRSAAFSNKQSVAVLTGLLLSPAILTQSTMVSYDIAMLAAFLYALSGIFRRTSWPVVSGTILLGLLSVRGIQLYAVIVAIYLLAEKDDLFKIQTIRKTILLFLPAYLVVFSWHYYHFTQTGWAVLSPSDSWAGHRDLSGLSSLPGQCLALLRAFTEQGALVLWVLWLWTLFFSEKYFPSFINKTIVLTLALGFLPFLFFSSPILARYTLVLQALLIIGICGMPFSGKRWLLPFSGVVLLSGHLWIYRNGLSNSWETSLMHIPYFYTREKVFDYLDNKKIPPENTATHFPLYTSKEQTDLAGDTTRLTNLSGKGISDFAYVIMSDFHNDFSPETKKQLETKWTTDTSFRQCGLKTIVYSNPAPTTH